MELKQTLSIIGRYDQIQKACDFAANGAAELKLSDDDIFKIRLACDEAISNIIDHAYQGESSNSIQVSWIIKDSSLTIKFRDQGQPFQPKNVPLPAANDPQVGGYGLHIIRKIMDEVHFSFDESGNTLTLTKLQMDIKVKEIEQDITLISVAGRLDHDLGSKLENTLTRLIENNIFNMIIDLSETSYINSSGLRILVGTWRQVRKNAGNLVLFGLSRRLLDVFAMVGFDKVFQIGKDQTEAVAMLRQKS